MQKLGKFIPTATKLVKSAASGKEAGQVASKAGQTLSGQSVQTTPLKPPGLRTTRSFASSTSASPSLGEATPKGVRSRSAASMPAGAAKLSGLAQHRDTKGAQALPQPSGDVEPTQARRLSVGSGEAIGHQTVDELHGQMHEHTPLPTPSDHAKAQARAKEDARFSGVVKQASALQGPFEPRKVFLDPELLQLTPAERAQIKAFKEAQTDGLVKRPTLALDSDDWRVAVKQFMPQGSHLMHVFTAEEVNEIARNQGKDPPWKSGTKVVAARFPAETRLWQIVSDKRSASGESQLGGIFAGKKYFGDWFLVSQPGDADEARFLAAIREAYKEILSHAVYINLDQEATVLLGIAGEMPDGLTGGAVQVQCPDKRHMALLHVVALAPETGHKPESAMAAQ